MGWSTSDDAGVSHKEDLRSYGRKTRQTGEDLARLFTTLTNQMNLVCEGWDDKKNKEFMAQFVKTNKEIQYISKKMKEFADFIDLEVKKIEIYESNRVKPY